MTITVTKNGVAITGIIWTGKTRWTASPQYEHHKIPYADKGIIYARGKDNATCTLTGRCLKQGNEALVASLEGATIKVTTTFEAERTAYVTGAPTTDRGAWWYITLSLTEE